MHKMEGKLCGDRRRLRSIALLQTFSNAAVNLYLPYLSQSLGQDLAIERMLKPVAPTEGPVRPLFQAGRLQKGVLMPERVTDSVDMGYGDLQPRRHRGGGKHVPHYTGDFQDALL